MDYANELSSSLSFACSSHVTNGSTNNNESAATSSDPAPNLENLTLNRLSGSLEKLLLDPEYDYTDAEIVVEDIPIGVHRCILAARSQFFHQLFKKEIDSSTKDGKPRYLMTDLVPYGKVGYESFNAFLNYLYTGKLKPSPIEVSTCVDELCPHDACGPAINYAVELMYASATFQMKELVLLVQRRLINFIEKAVVEDLITILLVAFHCELGHLLSLCIQTIATSDHDSVSLEKELPHKVLTEIKSLRLKSQKEAKEPTKIEEVDPAHEKGIKRILKALDSDDIELVELLLKESNITLNDAHALHYVVSYCDPKVIKEVLNLNLVDINLRNSRGYTVLHLAARRKDPKIIVALLDKGAYALVTTRDGQSAVAICRRLTRLKDYNETTVQGQNSNKNRLCIDVLEREMQRNSISGDISFSSWAMSSDDMDMLLDYLEDRVACANVLFPTEAKVAMAIAEAESTTEYTGPAALKGSSGNLREVDLNESPSLKKKRLQLRMKSLIKTVETGKRFFPNCSEVIEKFLEDYKNDHVLYLEKGTEEERIIKRKRFMEVREEVQKAFYNDMAQKTVSGLSLTSSTSSLRKVGIVKKVRKK